MSPLIPTSNLPWHKLRKIAPASSYISLAQFIFVNGEKYSRRWCAVIIRHFVEWSFMVVYASWSVLAADGYFRGYEQNLLSPSVRRSADPPVLRSTTPPKWRPWHWSIEPPIVSAWSRHQNNDYRYFLIGPEITNSIISVHVWDLRARSLGTSIQGKIKWRLTAAKEISVV